MKRYRYIKSNAFAVGALGLNHGTIRQDLPVRIIDAGLRSLIVPIATVRIEGDYLL